MKRQIHIGRYEGKQVFVTLEVKSTEKGRCLSMSGVVGPKPNGDADSCGQIDMLIKPHEIVPAEGLTHQDIRTLWEIWKRWHLNDLRAGTPAQEAYVRELREDREYERADYPIILDLLTQAGLSPDPETGYKYGMAWLYEPVPKEVFEFLDNLPDDGVRPTPAWQD